MKNTTLSAFAVFLVAGLIALAMLPVAASASSLKPQVRVGDTFIATSERGVAITADDGETVKKMATFSLTLEVTSVGENGFKFTVKSGTITVDGTVFRIEDAQGRVNIERKVTLVGLKGSLPDGEVHLGGTVRIRDDAIVLRLRGPLSVGDAFYWLRFLTTTEKIS